MKSEDLLDCFKLLKDFLSALFIVTMQSRTDRLPEHDSKDRT